MKLQSMQENMFKQKDVHQYLKKQIAGNEVLNVLMNEFGGILAGGLAHSLSKNICIEDHMTANEASDIDIYFRSENQYLEAVRFLKSESLDYEKEMSFTVDTSLTGGCHNIFCSSMKDDSRIKNCKIQLVGCITGEPKDVISTFDFSNLEVCFFVDNKRYVMLFSNKIRDDLLIVKHSNSPFLMHRINKYISYRGFSGITHSSRRHVTDWIIKATTGHYEKLFPNIYVELIDNFIFKAMLRNKDLISDDDLILLVGKIKEKQIVKTGTYVDWKGYTRSIFENKKPKDIALCEIKNRSKLAN